MERKYGVLHQPSQISGPMIAFKKAGCKMLHDRILCAGIASTCFPQAGG
jgi:hypothetical protein